ncbi:alpha/beta fold hydrolase [Microbacterium oleivorans]|uniref:Alpha/beta fold hydrolase n=1 Tax=Microbacterium oleivorans TaxID=273677 RepID=A0A4R5YPP0_9MICO|nr:alpha/beta fold hydrolase [Microbacterium oleivorans]TDL45317.1 alpha/beta fold hydrolase [Microbacterium oleivorans]
MRRRDDATAEDVTVDGRRVRVVRSRGPATTRTILLVHGIGMSHRYLRRLHTELARTESVVSIDLPGFGGTPKPGEDLDVPAMAAAIAGLLDRLGLQDVVAVGHSMGSQWVVELAIQRPDLITHVVAMGPVVDDRHRTAFAQARALALDTFGETPRANWLVLSDYVRCGIPWYTRQLRHMLAYPLEDRVRLLSLPLLVLRGARDPVAGGAWCRRLAAAAPDAAVAEIPGGFHVVQDRAPRDAADAITAFVAARTPPVPGVRR